MYLTPNVDIFNFTISVVKQYNMEVKMFPDFFNEIPKGKQVRITLEIQLKSAPYNIPTVFINFVKKGRTHPEEKNYNIYLPCSLHRFLEFESITDKQQFLNNFQTLSENIIKTT